MRGLFAAVLIAVAPPAPGAEPPAPVLSPQLEALAAEARFGTEVPVIISFADRIDPRSFQALASTRERRHRLLLAARHQSQDGLRRSIAVYLRLNGARDLKPLWLTNSVAATVSAGLLAELARWPVVARVRLDAVVQAPTTRYDADTPAEWNIQALRAPEVWGLGYYGQGVTVAIMDTGVDGAHPDLRQQYRGGSNSWFDPYGEHTAPYDAEGHGTAVAGLVLGRNASGNAIGVAPDARWIAAKIFDDRGQATLSAIHEAFQWLLDPDGDPASNDAPDLVNASWGLTGAEPCSNEFGRDVEMLRAAGIGIVFSAGNNGPGPGTTASPGNNPGALSVAAVDSADEVAPFSSRGPSPCDGALDPEVAAPGVSVYTADTGFGLGSGTYAYLSGTSFAAPHVTGVMALLWSARPTASVAEVEAVVRSATRDLGAAGPDTDTGNGMPDAYAGVAQMLGSQAPIAARDTASTAEDTPITIDVLANDLDPRGGTLTVTAVASPTVRGGTVVRNSDQTLTYTPPADFSGSDSFTYTLANGALTSTGSVVVSVLPVNDVPVAVDDQLVLTADAGSGNFALAAPGVLANDRDADGDVLSATLATGATSGSLQFRSDGGFSYAPTASAVAAGPLAFSYRAGDGVATSNVAAVSVTLNHAPMAADDVFALLTPDPDGSYRVPGPGVLGNDTDVDGNPLGASLVSGVASGALVVAADGGFVYTPPASDPARALSFSYRAGDGHAPSNVATVNLTVNRPPLAADDRVTLRPTGSGTYALPAPGILGNDADPDRDSLTPVLVRPPGTGAVALDASGAVTYTPPPAGPVPSVLDFTYRVRDGTATSNVANVVFNIELPAVSGAGGSSYLPPTAVLSGVAPESPPAVTFSDAFESIDSEAAAAASSQSPKHTDSGRTTSTADAARRQGDEQRVEARDDDIVLDDPDDKGRYVIEAPGVLANDHGADRPSAVLVRNVRAGKVALAANGGFTYSLPAHGAPDGELTFTYRVQDGTVKSDPATVTLSFRRPLTARTDTIVLQAPDARGVFHVPAPGVLANDRGPGALRAVLVQATGTGRIRLAPDGGFSYVPPAEGAPRGPVSFTYKAVTGRLSSRTATVIFRVIQPLAARADRFVLAAVDERGRYVLPSPGVLTNDSGAGALTAIRTQNATVGSVMLAPTGGFTYVPPPGQAPAGPLSFRYRVSDGQRNSREETVTFTLRAPQAANSAPATVPRPRDHKPAARTGPQP